MDDASPSPPFSGRDDGESKSSLTVATATAESGESAPQQSKGVSFAEPGSAYSDAEPYDGASAAPVVMIAPTPRDAAVLAHHKSFKLTRRSSRARSKSRARRESSAGLDGAAGDGEDMEAWKSTDAHALFKKGMKLAEKCRRSHSAKKSEKAFKEALKYLKMSLSVEANKEGQGRRQLDIARLFCDRSFSPHVKDPAAADALFAEAVVMFRSAKTTGFTGVGDEVVFYCEWGQALMRHVRRESRSQGLYPGGEPPDVLLQEAIDHFRRSYELQPDTKEQYSKAFVAWGHALAEQARRRNVLQGRSGRESKNGAGGGAGGGAEGQGHGGVTRHQAAEWANRGGDKFCTRLSAKDQDDFIEQDWYVCVGGWAYFQVFRILVRGEGEGLVFLFVGLSGCGATAVEQKRSMYDGLPD